jgi:hypothetical protein
MTRDAKEVLRWLALGSALALALALLGLVLG